MKSNTNMNTYKVIIDSACKISYMSYYIIGLYEYFGKENVSFSSKYFSSIKHRCKPHTFTHRAALVIISSDKKNHKIIIDFQDDSNISEIPYAWCDIYAKINLSLNLYENLLYDKVISIPPSFGIHIWNFWETAYYCITNYLKCRIFSLDSFMNYIYDYYLQLKRAKINDYLKKNTSPIINLMDAQYIFMIATLWHHENCIENTNEWRKSFINLCKLKT